MPFGRQDLLEYLKAAKLAVVSTVTSDGPPQSALVGIATSDDFEIVFDTVSTARKHANLVRDPRISLVVSGPDEKTLQCEGVALRIPTFGPEGADLRETYYQAWPDGRERLDWAGLAYWCIRPRWARYSDFGANPPLVEEFTWP